MTSCTKNSAPSLTKAVYLLRITMIRCPCKQNRVEKAAIWCMCVLYTTRKILPRKVGGEGVGRGGGEREKDGEGINLTQC